MDELNIKIDPNENIKNYQEFCKLALYNHLLNDRLASLNEEKEKIQSKLNALQEAFPGGKKKRFRRNANQIRRIFRCENCDKAYGSEASLKNHLKFKHSDMV